MKVSLNFKETIPEKKAAAKEKEEEEQHIQACIRKEGEDGMCRKLFTIASLFQKTIQIANETS